MSTHRPLRVALVCPFGLRPKATVGTRALPMAQALRRRGHEVTLFVPPWDDPDPAPGPQVLGGVEVVPVPTDGGPPAIAIRLLRAVLSFRPDLVHIVKSIGYSAAVAQALRPFGARLSSTPLLLDADDWEGRGGWSDCLARPAWQRLLISWQERWCFRHADAVTVASEALRTIAWSLGARPDRVHHLPNALASPLPAADPEAVAEVRRRHALQSDTVLLYTRFAEYSPAWPVPFLRSLRARRPEARLLVVGQGLRREEEQLRRAAAAASLSHAIVWAGWPGLSHLPALAGAADTAIFPYQDSLISRTKCSVKLLELMSLAVPVVASAVGENVAHLDHGRAGVLVAEPSGAEAWAEAVAWLLSHRHHAERLGRAAAARVRQRYLWDAVVPTLERAYDAALAGRR